jgi:hypothetical protein
MTDRLEVPMTTEGPIRSVVVQSDVRDGSAARTSDSIRAIVYHLHRAGLAVDAMRESIESAHGLRRADAADLALNMAIRDLRTLATTMEREMALIPVRSPFADGVGPCRLPGDIAVLGPGGCD